MKDEFEKRNVKMIGLVTTSHFPRVKKPAPWRVHVADTELPRIHQSANGLESHGKWIEDINDISRTTLQFPIIADADRKVAWLYDMLDAQDTQNIDQKGIAFTIRSVFVIDPNKKIRLTMMYPASTGRNTAEVLRVVDSLQLGDKKGVTTPIDWQVGDDVIVPPSVSTEAAKEKFKDVREVRPYLRFVKNPA